MAVGIIDLLELIHIHKQNRESFTTQLTSGALEMSNVETADTLVQMIEAQRAFEQRAKIIATAGTLDEAGSGLMALR
jgi:flagellar basal-body rod protein FlgF